MLATFSIKLAQFEKTGSIAIFLLESENQILFSNLEVDDHLFESKVCLPFNKGHELNSKINQKSNATKKELEPEQIL